MIIGIAGTLGAGKGTVVQYLKGRGFSHYSSSDMLGAMLRERHVPETRANLSSLADELAQKYEGGILHVSHECAQKEGVRDYLLESIHRESEAEYIRSIGGIVLGVDADTKTRYERAVKRNEGVKDNVTFEQFLQDSEREDEGRGAGTPHIRAVLQNADAVVQNNGTLEELHKEIDRVLEEVAQ